MSALRKSIGPLPLVAMGAAGIIGTSWIYTNGEFFAAYGAGGEIFPSGSSSVPSVPSVVQLLFGSGAAEPRGIATAVNHRGRRGHRGLL